MQQENRVKSPVIGISATVLTVETGSLMGRERAAVGQDYVAAILAAGGIPILLPVLDDPALAKRQMDLVDGLLLSGGYDVHPRFYGEEPQIGLDATRPERDIHEMALLQVALQTKKPVLAICRGIQLLNVALGGTLHQEIGTTFPSPLQHYQKSKVGEGMHHVHIVPNTKLYQVCGETVLFTNSLHHQAIKDLAPGLIVSARTQDGMIEGVEKEEEDFVLGVQWHPELMFQHSEHMLQLFHAFVCASRPGAALKSVLS